MSADQAGPAIPDEVETYLNEKRTLTLATASPDGVPHATTLVYANDGGTLFVWTHANSATARLLGQNPVVGFTIDEYSEDWRETRGVQGTGECEPVGSGDELARVGDLFGQRFPDLRPGASGTVAFYRIVPRELVFIDNTASDPAPDEYRRESIIEPPSS